jgi:hypothetical protein
VDYSNDDYVVFTLAGGGSITLPKYKAIGITFTQPAEFAPGETKNVSYTLTGDVQFVKAMDVPQSWSVKVTKTGNAGTFTVTAPATFDAANMIGEAVILISDGAERTVMRTLSMAGTKTLQVDKSSIEAGMAGGNYSMAVTSNTTWTAAVSAGATWCTASPASGTGDGAVTVNVADNAATVTRAATVTIAAGTLSVSVHLTQAAFAPSLSVNKTAIVVNYPGGANTVSLTSNTTWMATVSAGATWCTVSPANGFRSGAVTITVAENAATVTRAATVTIAAGTASQTVSITQEAVSFFYVENAPTYAASNRVWEIGNQRWSDAIRIPACNGSSFANSDTDPHCRSYTSGTNTWYYYNWRYVDANAKQLCPSPWHLPSPEDFNTLVSNITFTSLINRWGYGGFASGSSVWNVNTVASYWSHAYYSNTNAYSLNYSSSGLSASNSTMSAGFQVRCVMP